MAILDVAKLQYSCSVTPIEEQERHVDDGTVLRGIHSRIGKALGGSIEKSLASMTSIVYEESQTVNSTGFTALDGDPCTYEGFTWIANDASVVGGIGFLFVRIIEPVTAGQTPSVIITLDNAASYLIWLKGSGDWAQIPLVSYTVQDAANVIYLKVRSTDILSYAKIEWMVAKV